MIKHISIIMVALVVLLGLVAYSMLESVPYNEIHVIQRFGENRVIIDGRTDSGLHWKWPKPIESSIVFDARIHTFQSSTIEVKTSDQKALMLTLTCSWDIKDPSLFLEKVKSADVASKRIREQLHSAKGDVVGKYTLSQFVNVDPSKVKLQEMENMIAGKVSSECDKYGVGIHIVRFKLQALPESVTKSVFESVKSSQQEEVNRYMGKGAAVAMAIRTRAEKAEAQILAMARRKAGEIRSKGEQAAADSYKIMSSEPWLASYLRELETLETSLKTGTTLLLDSTYLPALKYIYQGPPKFEKAGE